MLAPLTRWLPAGSNRSMRRTRVLALLTTLALAGTFMVLPTMPTPSASATSAAPALDWGNVGVTGLTGTGAINGSWVDVVYAGPAGQEKFVAVGKVPTWTVTDHVMWSADGLDWSVAGVSGVPSADWRSIAYGNGTFVAVGMTTSTPVMTSADGLVWSTAGVSGVPSNMWRSVIYAGSQFVAVVYGYGAGVMVSSDGLTWTAAGTVPNSSTGYKSWEAVAYGGPSGAETYVAVGVEPDDDAFHVMTSSDGLAWAVASVQNEADRCRLVQRHVRRGRHAFQRRLLQQLRADEPGRQHVGDGIAADHRARRISGHRRLSWPERAGDVRHRLPRWLLLDIVRRTGLDVRPGLDRPGDVRRPRWAVRRCERRHRGLA